MIPISDKNHSTGHKKLPFCFWCFFLLLLTPWAWLISHMAVNADNLWLCTALDRHLAGDTLIGNIYEPNPPLSLFTCLLPHLIHNITGLALHNAITLFAMACIALSVLAVTMILRTWPFLARQDIYALAAGFALAETILTGNNYISERDHLIALGLIPFVLTQLALTYKFYCPGKILWPVLIIGAVLILLKPHHGLLPTLLLLHRAISQRRWSVVRDPDFLCLAGATIGSTLITLYLFPDFFSQMLPDVLALYIRVYDWPLIRNLAVLVTLGMAALLLAWRSPLPREKKNFAVFLIIAALISLVPYFVQARGYYNHLFPAFGFFGAGLGFLFYQLLCLRWPPWIMLFASTGLFTLLAYLAVPPDMAYPTHESYSTLPLTRMIATCDGGAAPCPFFIFDDTMGITLDTAYYAHAPWASRFPSDWFLPRLFDKNFPGRDALRHRFAGMIAADLDRDQPPLILIGQFDFGSGGIFDFPDFFSLDPAFTAAWAHYRFVRAVTIDRSVYRRGAALSGPAVVTYDLYKRR